MRLHSPCGLSLAEDTTEVSLCLVTRFHKHLKSRTPDGSCHTKHTQFSQQALARTKRCSPRGGPVPLQPEDAPPLLPARLGPPLSRTRCHESLLFAGFLTPRPKLGGAAATRPGPPPPSRGHGGRQVCERLGEPTRRCRRSTRGPPSSRPGPLPLHRGWRRPPGPARAALLRATRADPVP